MHKYTYLCMNIYMHIYINLYTQAYIYTCTFAVHVCIYTANILIVELNSCQDPLGVIYEQVQAVASQQVAPGLLG